MSEDIAIKLLREELQRVTAERDEAIARADKAERLYSRLVDQLERAEDVVDELLERAEKAEEAHRSWDGENYHKLIAALRERDEAIARAEKLSLSLEEHRQLFYRANAAAEEEQSCAEKANAKLTRIEGALRAAVDLARDDGAAYVHVREIEEALDDKDGEG